MAGQRLAMCGTAHTSMSPGRPRPAAHSTDCHVHIFDPQRFPYSPARRYTPPPATLAQLQQVHAGLGIDRTVLVQPSVYGTDNRCMLDALKRLGDGARGIAVIDESFGQGRLEDMFAAGVRGVRINLEVSKDADATAASRRLRATAEALGGCPMLIQVYAAMPVLLTCAPLLRALRQQVLIDHFGLALASAGTRQVGFVALLDLMASPNLWMKLSAPYQISDASPSYANVAPIARTMIEASPHRVVWGSDWPHTGGSARSESHRPADLEPFRMEDDAGNFELAWDWAPDEAMRQRLLVANPARLFGFHAS